MNKSVLLVTYGENDSTRNILEEENFIPLVEALKENGFSVEAVLYNNSKYEQLRDFMKKFDAVQVWVNPISGGNDRSYLDALLSELADNGVYVSTHPDVIQKIGTKKVLYTSRKMSWSRDVDMYETFDDFKLRFLKSLNNTDIRVLKQYRGQSGDGIFKVSYNNTDKINVTHATSQYETKQYTPEEFTNEFNRFFDNGGMLINQQWINNISNGMVRAYITGKKVSGFGYQETVALDPNYPTSKRFYFSEHCGLFQDLRNILESTWIPQLLETHSISDDKMSLLWDIDFFIEDVNSKYPENKYILCEINVSSVSPFPPSCGKHMADMLRSILMALCSNAV